MYLARYTDLAANTRCFPNHLPLSLGDSSVARFLSFSDWLYTTTRKTDKIVLDRDLQGYDDGLGMAHGEAHAASVAPVE